MTGDDAIRTRVRQVLLADWYIEPLLRLARGGAGEDAVVEFLHERERESMCFPSLGTARLRPVARKLLALFTSDTKAE